MVNRLPQQADTSLGQQVTMTRHGTDREQVVKNGSTIRDLRTRLGISQEELAHAVDIEQSLVSKIELDRVKSIKTRLRISDALKTWTSN